MAEVMPARTSPTQHPHPPPTVHQLSWLALWSLYSKTEEYTNIELIVTLLTYTVTLSVQVWHCVLIFHVKNKQMEVRIAHCTHCPVTWPLSHFFVLFLHKMSNTLLGSHFEYILQITWHFCSHFEHFFTNHNYDTLAATLNTFYTSHDAFAAILNTFYKSHDTFADILNAFYRSHDILAAILNTIQIAWHFCCNL